MKKILSLLLLSVVSNALYAQVYEDDAIADINKSFTLGQHKYEILEPDFSAEFKVIYRKYTDAMVKNLAWFNNYKVQFKEERNLPYHANFGITEPEYKKMLNEFNHHKLKVKTAKTLDITNSNDTVVFTGIDSFKVWDNVKIDLASHKIFVDKKKLEFVGEIYEADSSKYGAWKGYKWKYQRGSMEDVKSGRSTDYDFREISIGRTAKTNDLLMIYKIVYVVDGLTKAQSTISGHLK